MEQEVITLTYRQSCISKRLPNHLEVAPKRLSLEAFAEEKQLQQWIRSFGRQQNRRVEVLLCK